MKARLLPIFLLVVLVSSASGCRKDPFAIPSDAARTPSGVASKILHMGLGSTKPTIDSTVAVHYTGWTADGKEFESTRDGRPAAFGVAEVIPGWTEILLQMVAGEKRRVWIPGHLAYDNDPRPGVPKGLLIFDMELVAIK